MLQCPNCGVSLSLSLERSSMTSIVDAPLTEEDFQKTIRFVMGGVNYELSRNDIKKAAKRLRPNTVQKYGIQLTSKDGQEEDFPIKQVIRGALSNKPHSQFSEHGFTAHRARDILRRLGFNVTEWK